MLRQYGPDRGQHATLPNGRAAFVGTIPIGTLFRMVHRLTPEGRSVLRLYIIEAWLPRRVSGWRSVGGRYDHSSSDAFIAQGGHLARVRCLSDGTRTTMADHVIRRWVDLDPRHEWLPVPPAIPERQRHAFRRIGTVHGTCFAATARADESPKLATLPRNKVHDRSPAARSEPETARWA